MRLICKCNGTVVSRKYAKSWPCQKASLPNSSYCAVHLKQRVIELRATLKKLEKQLGGQE